VSTVDIIPDTRDVIRRRVLAIVAVTAVVFLSTPGSVLACSPPFERPTIRALGPAQLVVVGRVGERVAGGRLFHVERWFNGGEPANPIVIGFKEGEPVGDCSYPVSTGERKIIAPWREPDGRLSADLGTLQADPTSEDGRRLVDEAIALFGPGVVPEPLPTPATDRDAIPWLPAAIGAAILVTVAALGLPRRGTSAR
jgi:hypothetical protein